MTVIIIMIDANFQDFSMAIWKTVDPAKLAPASLTSSVQGILYLHIYMCIYNMYLIMYIDLSMDMR